MRPSLGSGAGEDAHMSQKQHEMAKSATSQPGSSNGPPGTHGNDLPKISLDHVEHKSGGPPVMHAGSREAREAALRQAQTPKHSNKVDPAAGPGREARGSSYHMQQRGYGHGPPSGYANESYGSRPTSYHEGPPPQNVQPPAPHYGGGDRYSSPRPDRGPSGPGTERYPSYPGRAPHTSSGRDSRGAYSYSSKAGVPPYNSGPSHPAPSYGGPPMPSASFEHREGNRGPGPVYYPDGPVPRSRQPDDSYARAPQYSSSYGGYEGGNRQSGYENQPPPNRHYGGGPPPAISNNGSWGAPGNDRTHPPERGQPYGFDSRGAPPPAAFDQYGPPKRTYSSENPYSAPPPSGPRSAPPQGNYPIVPSSQVPKSRGGPPSQAPINQAGPVAAKSDNLSRTVSGSFEQKSNASHGSFAKASMVHHADTVQQSPAMHTGNNDRPVKRENDREARETRTHTRARSSPPPIHSAPSDNSWAQLQNVASVEEPNFGDQNRRFRTKANTNSAGQTQNSVAPGISTQPSHASTLTNSPYQHGHRDRDEVGQEHHDEREIVNTSSLDSLSDVASIQDPIDATKARVKKSEDPQSESKKRRNPESCDNPGDSKRDATKAEDEDGNSKKPRHNSTSGSGVRKSFSNDNESLNSIQDYQGSKEAGDRSDRFRPPSNQSNTSQTTLPNMAHMTSWDIPNNDSFIGRELNREASQGLLPSFSFNSNYNIPENFSLGGEVNADRQSHPPTRGHQVGPPGGYQDARESRNQSFDGNYGVIPAVGSNASLEHSPNPSSYSSRGPPPPPPIHASSSYGGPPPAMRNDHHHPHMPPPNQHSHHGPPAPHHSHQGHTRPESPWGVPGGPPPPPSSSYHPQYNPSYNSSHDSSYHSHRSSAGPPPPSSHYSHTGHPPGQSYGSSSSHYRGPSPHTMPHRYDDLQRRTSPPMSHHHDEPVHPSFQAPRHEFAPHHTSKPPPTVYIVPSNRGIGRSNSYDPSMIPVNGHPSNHHMSNPFGWTPEDDQRLSDIMKKYKNPSDWEIVSKEHNRGKSAKQCHERWIRYLKPGVRKGQWQDHEDAIVIEAVTTSEEQPFTRWSELAQRLPGRVGKQIRDRWVNHLNPAINHMPFTREDDLLLYKGHQELGKRWVEISSKFFNGSRSENHIKNRWYSASFKKFITNEFGPDAYSKRGGLGSGGVSATQSKDTGDSLNDELDDEEESESPTKKIKEEPAVPV